MSQVDAEFWGRARRARDTLAAQFLDQPDVTLIDIGYVYEGSRRTDQIALRVHVRERWMKAEPEERVAFPEQVDGIPVVVMLGEYQLETDAPLAAENAIDRPDSNTRSGIMGTGEDVAASVNDERDDLETMSNEETRSQCKALAKSTGKRCKKDASPGSVYCPVHQRMAGRRAQQANTEHTPPEEEVEEPKDPEWPLNDPTWREQAAFSLWFGHVTDEHGKQVWYTCVYNESGEQKPFEQRERIPRGKFREVAIDPWANWILKQAKLPRALEPIPTEPTVAVSPAPVSPYNAWIEILDVQVSEIGPSPGVPQKKLMAEVRFQVSGPERDTVTADLIPFRVEVHTVDLESRGSNLVASWPSQLQSQVFEYATQQEFPIPELGRHELHTIVLLLPPGEMMAYHRGPIVKVVP